MKTPAIAKPSRQLPIVLKQINLINIKLEKLTERIAKNNMDNLKAICEISTVLQNLEDGFYETNDIILKG